MFNWNQWKFLFKSSKSVRTMLGEDFIAKICTESSAGVVNQYDIPVWTIGWFLTAYERDVNKHFRYYHFAHYSTAIAYAKVIFKAAQALNLSIHMQIEHEGRVRNVYLDKEEIRLSL